MKKLLILLLLPVILFSQEKKKERVFSLQQIDSIAEKNGNILHDVYVHITIQKDRLLIGKKNIGEGGGHYSMYEYDDHLKRRKVLVKGGYKEHITYRDKHTEEIETELYYYNKELFFVRITKAFQMKGSLSKKEVYEIDMNKAINFEINENFSFDVQEWIQDKNEELLKHTY